jgi:DNA-directed RNA polymerase specialized sigma24 family protein
MLQTQSPVVPFFNNPLLYRFLLDAENRRLFTNVIMDRNETDRLELERRFEEHYFEMRFLGFVRKHIHYEALHLLSKFRSRQQHEPLVLNMMVGGEEGSGFERIELLEDPHISVEEEVVGHTLELGNLMEDPVLHRAILGLTQKQQTVLYLLYVKQMTEQEVADSLHVSQQAINKVKKASLALLRRKVPEHVREEVERK